MLPDTLEDVDQVCVDIDAVEAASYDQALHDTYLFGAQLGPTEIPVFRLCMYGHNRKLWMFVYDKVGAQASANLFTLVMTARANGLEPFGYLSKLFEQLRSATTLEAIEALLPWTIKAPSSCPSG